MSYWRVIVPLNGIWMPKYCIVDKGGRTEAVWKELLIQKKEGCEDGRSEEVWRTLYSDIVERVLYEGGGYQSTRG